MDIVEWIKLIASILIGIATAIPLIIKLVEYVQKAIKEKNWNIILKMVMDYMADAETLFDNGADRKEWVMSMVAETSKTVNYDIDMNVISNLIDNLCKMSKLVNVK